MIRCLALLFSVLSQGLLAQEVLNGSFEDNSFSPLSNNACNFDYDCPDYHQNMAHSNAWDSYAPGGLCFVGGVFEDCTQYFNTDYVWGPAPQHGDWAAIIYGHTLNPSWWNGEGPYTHNANAISLALSTPLEVGTSYALSYYILASPPSLVEYVVYHTTSLSVGISEKDTAFGELIHTSIVPDSIWRWQSVIFEASFPAEHITFKINTPFVESDLSLIYGTLIDNVSLSTNLALAEPPTKGLSIYPNPFSQELHIESKAHHLRIYDLMGKEQHRQVLSGRSQKLDLNHLPLGLYLLKTYNSQGKEMEQQKLLKSQ